MNHCTTRVHSTGAICVKSINSCLTPVGSVLGNQAIFTAHGLGNHKDGYSIIQGAMPFHCRSHTHAHMLYVQNASLAFSALSVAFVPRAWSSPATLHLDNRKGASPQPPNCRSMHSAATSVAVLATVQSWTPARSGGGWGCMYTCPMDAHLLLS